MILWVTKVTWKLAVKLICCGCFHCAYSVLRVFICVWHIVNAVGISNNTGVIGFMSAVSVLNVVYFGCYWCSG